MNMAGIGKYLIISGIILIIAGIVIWFGAGKSGWFGNLPGDIKVEKKNFSFYAPLTTMLVISAVLSFVLWILGKMFK